MKAMTLPTALLVALLWGCDDQSTTGDPDTTEDTAPADTTPADTTEDTTPADTTEDTASDPTPDVVEDTAPDPSVDTVEEDLPMGTLLGDAQITYYWVAYEGGYECMDPDTVLGECDGTPIATVCPDFADAARLEGTARLVDGRMINIGGCSCSGGYDCFVVLDTTEFPWGMGNRGNPLIPFVSVAVDTSVIDNATVMYSPDLDGIALPADMGGGTHDGCIRADDVGGGISGMHIDFFAALRTYYLEIDPQVPENVALYTDSPRCSL